MKVWIARDADGGLFMYAKRPNKHGTFFLTAPEWSPNGNWELPEALLRDVTWENSPKEFEMVMDIFELKAQIKKGDDDGE